MRLNDFSRREILERAGASRDDNASVTVDGESASRPTNSESMYSEAELKRAERRMCRERERKRKKLFMNQFFELTVAE